MAHWGPARGWRWLWQSHGGARIGLASRNEEGSAGGVTLGGVQTLMVTGERQRGGGGARNGILEEVGRGASLLM